MDAAHDIKWLATVAMGSGMNGASNAHTHVARQCVAAKHCYIPDGCAETALEVRSCVAAIATAGQVCVLACRVVSPQLLQY